METVPLGKPSVLDKLLDTVRPGGTEVVRHLQYEVREGGEAGEVVVIPKAFIANCNQSFLLLVVEEDEDGEDAVPTGSGAEARVI